MEKRGKSEMKIKFDFAHSNRLNLKYFFVFLCNSMSGTKLNLFYVTKSVLLIYYQMINTINSTFVNFINL